MIDLDAIRRRDAADMPVLPNLELFAQHNPDDAELQNAIHMVRDRRALLAYVDALREAAGRVTCARCYNQRKSCPECGALRALLNKETPNDRHG